MTKNKIDILFENDRILLINKPTGISVTPDRTGAEDIQQLLTKQLTLTESLRLIHRLDKETSGVMVIAKNKQAQSRYSRRFAKRQTSKLYLAIVNGPLAYPKGSIKDPIARSKRNPQAMHVHPRLGKPAHTVWQQLADFGVLSLVAVQPVTGRTHQIRVHFSHRGMPLAIDPVYGSNAPLMLSAYKNGYRAKRDKDESAMISRLTLHAYQLTIPVGSPDAEQLQTFVAPLDKKFAAAVKLLTKHTQNTAEGFADTDDFQKILNAEPLAYPLDLQGDSDGA
ncbi:MAG: RluA family pseudouridine synthase [Phycisphaerae bacterium]|nr:RluA family pseudouridine synthase [Phycisphaerae bacterium]